MGLEICHWLVSKGVRNLIITSRNGIKTPYHTFFIDRMKSFGACVSVVIKDVSDMEQAKELIDYAASFAPVGGVFHLAMVLKDALFENQTNEMFEDACKIKIRGTFNLDQITRYACAELDHFVCFSSLVSTIGNAGQSNYGFANSFMDNLCAKRRRHEFPALSIGWGAIGDVGHVAEKMGNDVVVSGSVPQRINSCFEVLEKVLYGADAVVGSLVPVDRSKFETKGDLLGAILNVLGIKDQSKLDLNSTLGDLGLDSLMAVEIKQILEKKCEKIMSTKQVRDLTVAQIRGMTQDADVIKIDAKEIDSNLPIVWKLSETLFEPLNSITKGEPIFVFPPIEGSFAYLLPMIEELTNKIQRPIIAVNWIADNNDQKSVEGVADYYLKRMDQDFPILASYDLIGYSFGSLICLQMALQCQASHKKKVRNLILLDFTPAYGRLYLTGQASTIDSDSVVEKNDKKNFIQSTTDYFTTLIKARKFNFNQKITSVPKDAAMQKYYNIIKSSNQYDDKDYIDAIDRTRFKFKLIHDYTPNQYLNQDALLIRATTGFTPEIEQSMAHDYELSKYVTGKVSVIKLVGDHKSFLIKNSEKIASEITDYVD